YILEAKRTPIGKLFGVLKSVRPDDLSALILNELQKIVGFDPKQVDEVIWGCANQAGEDNRNVARMALLLAGWDYEVPAVTVNRLCASSLTAVNMGVQAIWSGTANLVIAGGVESMTRAPWAMPKPIDGQPRGNVTIYDTALGWRFTNPRLEKRFPAEQMGETAENIADRYPHLTREKQDEFAMRSHLCAVAARHRFEAEIVPVPIPQKKGEPVWVEVDEQPRSDVSLEGLAALQPVFRKGGTVTAGNSSSLNDGASGVVLASETMVKQLNLKPRARILGMGNAGVDPRVMGLGPMVAVKKALQMANLKLEDIQLWEINEAFAIQTLAVMDELKLNPDLVNVNGGAIALGHPLGCSGARILTTLLYEMERRKLQYGVATLCVGVGQGVATVIERIE
ncbi:MAG: thiolase family protein, partial [bacterium]|nr:thiolase family protein [bacterium]